MVSEATYRKAAKIFSLCIVWYTVSSINNVVTKLILNEFPYPMTVTMVHLVSTTLYSVPVIIIWEIPSSARIPLRLWFKLILPLALGKVFASVSSHISIWKVPVSYAHTSEYHFVVMFTPVK
jgi:solute carrier family 35 protein E1